MLVLSRCQNESVVLAIGNEVICTITVVEFRGGPKVRLGFAAPSTLTIDREEVWKHRAAGRTVLERDAARLAKIEKLRKQADELERQA